MRFLGISMLQFELIKTICLSRTKVKYQNTKSLLKPKGRLKAVNSQVCRTMQSQKQTRQQELIQIQIDRLSHPFNQISRELDSKYPAQMLALNSFTIITHHSILQLHDNLYVKTTKQTIQFQQIQNESTLFRNINPKTISFTLIVHKNKMSQQIQSLLNEMENKFQRSFSQSKLEQPEVRQLNPQSARKVLQKCNSRDQLRKYDGCNQVGESLVKRLNGHLQNQQHSGINSNQLKPQSKGGSNCQTYINFDINKNKPSFKTLQDEIVQDSPDLRKVTSQQQFSKTNYQMPQKNVDNPFYYRELTMKLEKALNKISSQKVFRTKINKQKQFNFYDRFELFQLKKKRQIQRKKQQLVQKQIKSVVGRPLINSHSRALVQQMGNDPIYIRCQKIIQNRKAKQEQNKRMKQEKQEKQYEQFKQQYQRYMDTVKLKYQGKGVRSTDEYYSEMESWLRKKQKNVQSKILQKTEKQKAQNTFRPMINSKSQKIILKRKQQRHIPIHERQPKLRQQKADPNCTFQPKINKGDFHKKMTYYQPHF